MTEATATTAGSWHALLGRDRIGTTTVLAGGVALYATNEFLTISLMPSTVNDIGGQRFYAWVVTVYLVGSVVTATAVNPLLMRFGPRTAYLSALTVFGVGTAGCALAPTMELLLVARTVQGAAGGMLAGLGYAVINAALPSSLWTRASALVSAMWGVSVIVGPAMGGVFAQFGIWRWAFGSLAIATAAMVVLVPGALPPRDTRAAGSASLTGIPVWSLLLLGVAALAISVAGVQRTPLATAGLLVLGVALVAGFLFVDRRAGAAVLPRAVFGAGALKWMYVTIGLLMAATMVDMYVPLYGQRLALMTPVAAGFLGAVLAIGWTVSEIASASVDRTAAVARMVAVSPAVMAVGLAAVAVTMNARPSWAVIAVWVVGLLIAGAGVGVAWPHLSAWIMGFVDDPIEAGAAAAAINTVQLVSGAFGAGIAGVVVNTIGGDDSTTARWLFVVFTALAACGLVSAYRAGAAEK